MTARSRRSIGWRFLYCSVLIIGCSSSEPFDPIDPDDPPPMGCNEGQTRCDEQCIDLSSDPGHCGVCGRACNEGLSCEDGRCAEPPPACELDSMGTPALCGDACVDLDTNLSHCGACNAACAARESCVGGLCVGPPPVEECEVQANGTLKTSMSDITLADTTVVQASLRHAYDIDEVASQGCLDGFELQVRLSGPGCTLSLVFAENDAGAGLVYAGFDVDSFCPGFADMDEGLYERTDGWGQAWFGLDKITDGAALQTCVAGEALSFDATPLRLLRQDGAELIVDLSEVDLTGWVPSAQDTSARCVAGASCGQARDGGDGWCLLAGCSPDFHEGGAGNCTAAGTCDPDFLINRGECSQAHNELFTLGESPKFPLSLHLWLGSCSAPGSCDPTIALQAYVESIDHRVVEITQTPDAWAINVEPDSSSPLRFDAAIDSTGGVHYCVGEFVGSDLFVFYVRRTSTDWEREEVGPAYHGCGIVVDEEDRPHVVYTDRESGTLIHRLRVQDGWVTRSQGSPDPDPFVEFGIPQIEVDRDSVAHILYIKFRDGPKQLWYARSTSEGFEPSLVLDSFMTFEHSLVVDAEGVPHIAYREEDLSRIEHLWLTDDGWSSEIVDGAGFSPGGRPVLLVGPDSRLHMVYDASSLGYAYQTMSDDGDLRWAHIRFEQSYEPLALALDDNLDIHILSSQSTQVRYSMLSGSVRCPEGEHDGGDGACLPIGECVEGYWDGGAGRCGKAPLCNPGFHDGGDGSICLPLDECLPGFQDDGNGTCLPIGE